MSFAVEQQQALACPFEPAVNPHAEWAQEATGRWALRHGLLQLESDLRRFQRWGYGILMARAYPLAPRETLALIADWNTWLFLMDDQFDEGLLGRDPLCLEAYCRQVIAILRGEQDAGPGDLPAMRAAADLSRRLHAAADPAFVARLSGCLAESFRASLWEAGNRALGRVPCEAEYRAHRPYAGAVYCYLTLIELDPAARLSDSEREDRTIRQLTALTNEIICWANDLHSLPRERASGNVHNLVTIVEYERALSLNAAVDYVIEQHNHAVTLFQALSAQVVGGGAVTRYLQGLQWWIRANMDWSTATTRYADVVTRSFDIV